jgi:SAM-dependent methyltransferase
MSRVSRIAAVAALPAVIVAEHITGKQRLTRRPEPDPVMDGEARVEEWVGMVRESPRVSSMALEVSVLTPPGGTVVDVACGSAEVLTALALLRPDVRVVGIDLSKPLLERGRQILAKHGVAERASLEFGDMTETARQIDHADVIVSLLSLHHLPDHAALMATLGQFAKVRAATGCAIYIHDQSRPRLEWTARVGEQLPPPWGPVSPVLRREAAVSTYASWTRDEMSRALTQNGLHGLTEARLRTWLRFIAIEIVQIWWIARADHRDGVEITRQSIQRCPLPAAKKISSFLQGLPSQKLMRQP